MDGELDQTHLNNESWFYWTWFYVKKSPIEVPNPYIDQISDRSHESPYRHYDLLELIYKLFTSTLDNFKNNVT